MPLTSFEIQGNIFEVLDGCGLVSITSGQGTIYTVDRHTPGINFDELRSGQRLRCQVNFDYRRVVHAELV